MADRIDCHITGTVNLAKELDEFKGSIQRRIIRPALQDVGKYFEDLIKSKCNFEHGWSKGLIRDAIVSKVAISTTSLSARVTIGPTSESTPHGKSITTRPDIYALGVEYGLKNPRVDSNRAGEKVSKHRTDGGVPDYPMQPFMRPAWDEGQDPALTMFVNRVVAELERRNKTGKLNI